MLGVEMVSTYRAGRGGLEEGVARLEFDVVWVVYSMMQTVQVMQVGGTKVEGRDGVEGAKRREERRRWYCGCFGLSCE